MKKLIEGLSGHSVDTNGIVYSSLFPNRPMYSRLDAKGYPGVMIKTNGKLRGFKVHRLVAQTFIPNPDNKPCVNHIDNDKTNNKLENLEWVTYLENTAHAIRQGRMKYPKGRKRELGNNSKLFEHQVSEIRVLKSQGDTNVAIAKRYGVHHSTVARIVTNKTWIEETV